MSKYYIRIPHYLFFKFILRRIYPLINIDSFNFLMLRIVPEVLIGDKIIFFPEISVISVNADITISFVW